VTHPYPAIVEDLTYAYEGEFSPESVAAAVTAAREALDPSRRLVTRGAGLRCRKCRGVPRTPERGASRREPADRRRREGIGVAVTGRRLQPLTCRDQATSQTAGSIDLDPGSVCADDGGGWA